MTSNERGAASHARNIGITQRAAPLVFPWTGELRVRFTDFQVNEISPDGSVVHLKTIGLGGDQPFSQSTSNGRGGSSKADTPIAKNEDAEEIKPKEQSIDVSPEDAAALAALAGQDFADKLVEICKTPGDPDSQKRKVKSQLIDDKFKRGQIHQEVRRIFKSRVDTSTDGSGAIIAGLIVTTGRGRKRGRGDRNNNNGGSNRGRQDKPAGEYIHFTMFKENRDTMDAVNQLARMLRVKPQSIAYAGTKDRRASTTQRCSVRYITGKTLAGLNGNLRSVWTGDYDYSNKPTRLGLLLGNEFVITVKDCKFLSGEPDSRPLAERLEVLTSNVQATMDHMASKGWINYFGHQRFGTHTIGTHEIGRLILAGKHEDAVNAILSYDEDIAAKAEAGEIPPEASKKDEFIRQQACMLFLTGKDLVRAEKVMPRRFPAEGSILRHLNRDGTQSRRDFTGALLHITKGLRSMYLHAYQSHVWNHAASRRWELHGDKVVEGDLVIADEPDANPNNGAQDDDDEDVVNPIVDDNDSEDEDDIRARPVTAAEVASGRFTIDDVVLPSPGYNVVYPTNEIGAFYESFMAREENGNLDPHKMRRLRREFSLPGRYRRLMNRFLSTPSVEFRAYADDTEQLHPTDLDLIRVSAAAPNGEKCADDKQPPAKKPRTEGAAESDPPTAQADDEMQQEQEQDRRADKIAAVLKFQLGRSAYATVALRELMGDPPEGAT